MKKLKKTIVDWGFTNVVSLVSIDLYMKQLKSADS